MLFCPNQFCNDTVINQLTHETCLLFVIKDWFQFDTDLIIDGDQAEQWRPQTKHFLSRVGFNLSFKHNLSLKGLSPEASCHSAHHCNNNVVTEMKCETQQQLRGTRWWRMAESWGRRPFERIECQPRPIRGQRESRRTNQRPGNISPQFINCNPIHPNPPEFCFNDCPVQHTVHYTRGPAKTPGTETQIAPGWENRVPRVRRNGECLSQMLVTIRHWRYLDTICLLSSSKLSSSERLHGGVVKKLWSLQEKNVMCC